MAVLSSFVDFSTSATILSLFFLAFYGVPAVRQYFASRKTAQQYGCQPPPTVSSNDPVLGLDVARQLSTAYKENRRSESFKEYHDTYGLTYQTVALRKTRIYTIEPDNLRAVFSNVKDWGVQPLRLPPWNPLLGKGVMDTDGTFWRHSRDMVQPLFKKEQISDLASFDIHVSNLIGLIPRDGSTVDLQPLFARLLLDFTTEFLFSKSVSCLTPTPDQYAMEFLESFQYGQAAMGKSLQLPVLSVFTSDKKFWRAAKIVRDFVGHQVDQAFLRCDSKNNEIKRKYVLADELVKVTRDKENIRNQLLNAFLAAHDTTATLLTNVMFNLARHPQVYEKLRQEVLPIDMQEVNFDELKGLPYLKNVVNETSRLTGVVEQTARIALNDTMLPTGGGASGKSPIYVPRGTSIQLNSFSLHRRPDIYGENVDKFVPERWEGLHPGAWEFMPFINGPRVCPAQQMALQHVRFTVARIAQTFKSIENRDPEFRFVAQYKVTSESKNGCKVGLTPA